jgi:steroid delta-isomerase-like uncharacterized protein
MNMAWAKRWLLENFNPGNMAGLEQMYHPNVKFADVPLGIDADGWAGVKGFLGGFFVAGAGKHAFVPDAYLGNEREGVVEWTWTGTLDTLDLFQVGDGFQGKTFKVRGNSVFRFDAQGRIVEERDYLDLSTVLRQLKG